ncbi:MAG: response regulator [Gammaproteobacteria bacterium]
MPVAGSVAPSPSGTGRVIVIDDDPIVCRFAERALIESGWTVVCAHDGEQALNACDQCRPDLAIIDYSILGQLSGIDLARRFKEMDVPFFFVTMCGDPAVAHAAIDSGAMNYLIKPVKSDDLIRQANICARIARVSRLHDAYVKGSLSLAGAVGYLMGRLNLTHKEVEAQFTAEARRRGVKMIVLAENVLKQQGMISDAVSQLNRLMSTVEPDTTLVAAAVQQQFNATSWLDCLVSSVRDNHHRNPLTHNVKH